MTTTFCSIFVLLIFVGVSWCQCVRDSDCQFFCVNSTCVECRNITDCGPFFSDCRNGLCIYEEPPEPTLECTSNDQCTDPRKPACVRNTCILECVYDYDCEPEKHVCSNGLCLECNRNSHCFENANRRPYCNMTTKTCERCDASTAFACADHPQGRTCTADGICGCASDTDCVGVLKGPVCSNKSDIPSSTNHYCTCNVTNGGDSQCTISSFNICHGRGFGCGNCRSSLLTTCANNPNGSYCQDTSQQCGCLSQSHCSNSSYGTICRFLSLFNSLCGCRNDSHCINSSRPLCDVNIGICVSNTPTPTPTPTFTPTSTPTPTTTNNTNPPCSSYLDCVSCIRAKHSDKVTKCVYSPNGNICTTPLSVPAGNKTSCSECCAGSLCQYGGRPLPLLKCMQSPVLT